MVHHHIRSLNILCHTVTQKVFWRSIGLLVKNDLEITFLPLSLSRTPSIISGQNFLPINLSAFYTLVSKVHTQGESANDNVGIRTKRRNILSLKWEIQ